MTKSLDVASLDPVAQVTLAHMKHQGPLPCVLDHIQEAEYEVGHAIRQGLLARGDEDSRQALSDLHHRMKCLEETWKMARVLIKDDWNRELS